MPTPLDELTTPGPVAKGLAQPGGVANPVLRYLAGLPESGGLPSAGGGEPVPQSRAPRQKVKKMNPEIERLMAVQNKIRMRMAGGRRSAIDARLKAAGNPLSATAIRAGPGYLPAVAFRKEIRDQYADDPLEMVPTNNLSPEEQGELAKMLDPEWVRGQIDPGGDLTAEEIAQAQAQYGKGSP